MYSSLFARKTPRALHDTAGSVIHAASSLSGDHVRRVEKGAAGGEVMWVSAERWVFCRWISWTPEEWAEQRGQTLQTGTVSLCVLETKGTRWQEIRIFFCSYGPLSAASCSGREAQCCPCSKHRKIQRESAIFKVSSKVTKKNYYNLISSFLL